MELENELSELVAKEEELKNSNRTANVEYERLTASEGELSHVINALERFVNAAECPACGTSFSDKASVFARLRPEKIVVPPRQKRHLSWFSPGLTA